MQYFKGDIVERKFADAGGDLLDVLALQKAALYDGAYSAQPLGDALYESERAPLTRAISQEVFRLAFTEIFDAFIAVGTFEAYLTVFSKIFGDDVVVEFTVPSSGKLLIDIEASGVELTDFVARYIEDNVYAFDEVIDDEGDNIAFQTVLDFVNQYELEQMLFEMVPNGIYTEITLSVG